MQQLVYASRPFGYDTAILAGILSRARVRNSQYDITGCLICRPDIYLQLLEGPSGKVDTLFDKICNDDRHVDVKVLLQCEVQERLFPDWAMRHDPAQSWLWSPQEINAGILEIVSPQDVRDVFLRSTAGS